MTYFPWISRFSDAAIDEILVEICHALKRHIIVIPKAPPLWRNTVKYGVKQKALTHSLCQAMIFKLSI